MIRYKVGLAWWLRFGCGHSTASINKGRYILDLPQAMSKSPGIIYHIYVSHKKKKLKEILLTYGVCFKPYPRSTTGQRYPPETGY